MYSIEAVHTVSETLVRSLAALQSLRALLSRAATPPLAASGGLEGTFSLHKHRVSVTSHLIIGIVLDKTPNPSCHLSCRGESAAWSSCCQWLYARVGWPFPMLLTTAGGTPREKEERGLLVGHLPNVVPFFCVLLSTGSWAATHRGLRRVEGMGGGGGIRTHEGYSPYTISSRAH